MKLRVATVKYDEFNLSSVLGKFDKSLEGCANFASNGA